MDCPESLEKWEELETKLALCPKTMYQQAEARIESGAASSRREAERQLAEETGRPLSTVRQSVRRGKMDTMYPDTNSEDESDSVDSPKSNEQFRTSFTGNNEWYTPQKYIDAARSVMGNIDLDPATSESAQKRINADRYFTEDCDGLERKWYGRVWLNPPYSQPLIYLFIDKLVSQIESDSIRECILLTHNYTDTAWFHLAESKAALICFTKGRIKFEDTQGNLASPTQGSAFFYFGDNEKKFREVFQEFGFIR